MRNNFLILVLLAIICVTFTTAQIEVEYDCGDSCHTGQGTTARWNIPVTDDLKEASGITIQITLPVNSTIPNDCYLNPPGVSNTNIMGMPSNNSPMTNGQYTSTRYAIQVNNLSALAWGDHSHVVLGCSITLSTLYGSSSGTYDFTITSPSGDVIPAASKAKYLPINRPPEFQSSMYFTSNAGKAGEFIIDLSNIPYKITEYDTIEVKYDQDIGITSTSNCVASGVNLLWFGEPTSSGGTLMTTSDLAQGEGMLYISCSIQSTPLPSDINPATEYKITVRHTVFQGEDTKQGAERFSGKAKIQRPEQAIIGGTADNIFFGFQPNYRSPSSNYYLVFETNDLNSRIPVDDIQTGGDEAITTSKPGKMVLTLPSDVYKPRGGGTTAEDLEKISCGLNVDNNDPKTQQFRGDTTSKYITVEDVKYLQITWVPELDSPATTFRNRLTRFFCNGINEPSKELDDMSTYHGKIQIFNHQNKEFSSNVAVKFAPFYETRPDPVHVSQVFRFNTTQYFNPDQSNQFIAHIAKELALDAGVVTISRQFRTTVKITNGVFVLTNDKTTPTPPPPVVVVDDTSTRTYLDVQVVIFETPRYTPSDIHRILNTRTTQIANRFANTLKLSADVPQVAPTLDVLPATCTNGKLDDDETDIDCGGKTCLGCSLNKSCDVDGDCVTGQCAGYRCYQSSDVAGNMNVLLSTMMVMIAVMMIIW